jgi:hypothetical protein
MGAAMADGARVASPAPVGLIAERLTAQLLAGRPARSASAVVERLLAVQGQDPRGFRLAVRARSEGLTVAHVERALGRRGGLVVNWLNRGTLHLVRAEDHAWLHSLTAPPLFTGSARRLAQAGVNPRAAERALEAIGKALAEEGPLTRGELRERIARRRVRTEGQALIELLMLACLRGIALRGPMAGREQAYALARDCLGDPRPVERERALAELARRYLRGHGPADERDLARWAGLPLRDARAGLAAIARQLRERRDGLLELTSRPTAAPLPAPRLLGSYEPLLLGWRSRALLLPQAHAPKVVLGGLFRPFALVEGTAVGPWSLKDGKVRLDPFVRLSREKADALRTDGEYVRRFLGLGTSGSDSA